MKLSNFGPWGVEDVSRSVGVPVSTLQRWHVRGWARATDVTSSRLCLRYQREDVVRVCTLAALRESGIRTTRAVRWCDAIEGRIRSTWHPIDRPVVTFSQPT